MHGTFKTIETKADPFSLDALIAWLEQQRANKVYDFDDCVGRCLLGQYLASIDIPWDMDIYEDLAAKVDPGAHRGCFPIGYQAPRTFGGALDRARARKVSLAS